MCFESLFPWIAHSCSLPGCNSVLVLDGDQKYQRDVCYAKDAGFIQFASMVNENRLSSYFCLQELLLHPAYKPSLWTDKFQRSWWSILLYTLWQGSRSPKSASQMPWYIWYPRAIVSMLKVSILFDTTRSPASAFTHVYIRFRVWLAGIFWFAKIVSTKRFNNTRDGQANWAEGLKFCLACQTTSRHMVCWCEAMFLVIPRPILPHMFLFPVNI